MKRSAPQSSKTIPKNITIVLADDHPLFLHGLRDVIGRHQGYEIVDVASNGEQALQIIERSKPAIAVLDIDMPKMTGLQVAREIVRRKLGTEVIILTMHEDAEHFENAMEAGAMGYVLKDSAVLDIVNCIQSVAGGTSYISPTLSRHLMNKNDRSKQARHEKLGLSLLTSAERKVLKLISESKSTKQIAEELYISVKTVSAHRSNICVKLNLHGTNALLKFALENKSML